jgi:hypothetical protein
MQASDNYKGKFDSFGKFIKARVRTDPYCEEHPTFKDFKNTFKVWHSEQNIVSKKLTDDELRTRLNELYQVPTDGKTYRFRRLFQSDEEAEEFDKELAENSSS